MFDNVAFNVVIGLVFIYLLYSLLVTMIGELISTKFGIRARLLRIAIERMLNDGYFENIERKINKWGQGWLRKNFLYEADEFKKSFAGRFYEYPAIKYLGRIEDDQKGRFSSTKPSYLSADYFADSLINFLEDKGVGTTSIDKIAFCLKFNTHHIQPKTLKQFINLFEAAGNDKEVYKHNLIKWFNETMDRANGWHKRKMRTISFYLALILATSFNVDSIRIAKILANDKEARNQLVNMGVALSKDSASYKDFVNSHGDTVHSSAIIDTGFNRITNDINAANLVLGLGWQFDKLLRKESLKIDRENDSAVFKYLFANLPALDSLEHSMYIIEENKKNRLNAVREKNDSIQLLIPDTLFKAQQISLANDNKKTELQVTLKKSQDSIVGIGKRIQNLLLSNKVDSFSNTQIFLRAAKIKNSINSAVDKYFSNISSVDTSKDGKSLLIYGERKYSGSEKVGYFFSIIFLQLGWLGLLITAFALSLGAPFWFDLLNKLVSIRGVGVKPGEKKDKNKETDITVRQNENNNRNQPLATEIEDPVSIALRIYGDQIKTEKGVINVAQGYYKENNILQKCIQVNVEDNIAAVEVKTKYRNLRVDENQFVYLNVLITGKPKLSGGFDDGLGYIAKGICNSITLENIGSYGCLVNKIDEPEKTFLLSCYHVLNADDTWQNRKVTQDIRNKEGVIAKSYEGFLTSLLDSALAEITDPLIINHYKGGLGCKVPKNTVVISNEDVFKTQAFVQGYSTVLSAGLIVNDSGSETFDYPLKNRKYLQHVLTDLIVISHIEKGFPEFKSTSHGDSGAIVFDDNDNALGIVVGSDLIHTYVIKIQTIFDFLGLKLTA